MVLREALDSKGNARGACPETLLACCIMIPLTCGNSPVNSHSKGFSVLEAVLSTQAALQPVHPSITRRAPYPSEQFKRSVCPQSESKVLLLIPSPAGFSPHKSLSSCPPSIMRSHLHKLLRTLIRYYLTAGATSINHHQPAERRWTSKG